MAQGLEKLTRGELEELVEIMAKDLIAIDGTWFQAVERAEGMDAAMDYDRAAWERYMPSETRRLKAFLGLPDQCGLEGIARALPLHCTSLCNEWDMTWEDDGSLLFRITDCRVQNARARKGMEFHPCKSVGLVEYTALARILDDRVRCECVSCYPDITDTTCNCAWRFWVEG